MDINKALADLRAAKLPDYSLADLRSMSAGCVAFVQNRIPDAVHLKSAIDDEIRRKEMQESADKLLQQTTKLSDQTAELTKRTTELVGIAEAQRVLAAKLDAQTRTLIRLTIALNVFTVVLIVLTIGLLMKEGFHLLEGHQISPRLPVSIQTNQQTH